MKNLTDKKRLGLYISGTLILISTIIVVASLGVVDEMGGCGGIEMDKERGNGSEANKISVEEGLGKEETNDIDLKGLVGEAGNKGIAKRPKCKNAGPIGKIGADAPLEISDKCLNRTKNSGACGKVIVTGFSAASVQQAINKASNSGKRYVYIPKGFYDFGTTTVTVPSNITLYGDGKTRIHTSSESGMLFRVNGDFVRITRMVLEGPDMNFSLTNVASFGILSENAQNLHVDHLEMRGFGWAAIRFDDDSTGQIDHCYIHHNLGSGLGYGVAVMEGSYVLITDNKFSQCRHMIASNGRLEYNVSENEHYYNLSGRTPHWTARRNLFSDDSLMERAQNQYPNDAARLWALDAHPGMNGTCAIECNIIEKVRYGIGLNDGTSRITDNIFREPDDYQPRAIKIGFALDPAWQNFQSYVYSAMPHDFIISGNIYQGTWLSQVYVHNSNGTYYGVNISNNGTIIPETFAANSSPIQQVPILLEMDSKGALRCYGSPDCP